MSPVLDHFMLAALAGGALIGLGATMSWIISGRHIGFAKCLPTYESVHDSRALWRLLIFIGLPIGGVLSLLFVPVPVATAASHPVVIIFAGILAGAGVRMLRGCLVGHTVCGLARQSPRSAISVLSFLAAAFVTGMLFTQVAP